MDFLAIFLITAIILEYHRASLQQQSENGVSIQEQLEHIADAKMESLGYPYMGRYRRFITFHPGESSGAILGAPSLPSHLPEAEPILPGHTLIRPALGMLKSSVKFPHKDLENGGGVYGNVNSLSITWGGTNERVLHTGFRRLGENDSNSSSESKSLLLIITNSLAEKDNEPEFHARRGKLGKINRRDKKRRKKQERRKQKKIKYKQMSQAVPSYWQLPLKKERNEQMVQGGVFWYDKKEVTNRKLWNYDLLHHYYDGFSKVLRDLRRHEMTSKEHDHSSIEVEIEDVKPLKDKDPDPKLTWFWSSKDLFNHITIRPNAPDWTELMPVVPKDELTEWAYFHRVRRNI